MENKEPATEGEQPVEVPDTELTIESTKTKEIVEDDSTTADTDASETKLSEEESEPIQNGEVEPTVTKNGDTNNDKQTTVVDKGTTEPSEKPTQTENKPVRNTRGTKRKALDNEKSESTTDSTSSGIIEQKENVGSKNKDNLQDESDLKDDSSLNSLSESNIMGKGKRARIPNKRYSDILLSPNRKSVHQKPLDNIVEPEVPIKIKEEPFDSPVSSGISSPSLPKKNRASITKENLQDPKYLKPFKYEWKRELVWRSTSTQDKRMGDIYYYAPGGKKVRSLPDIDSYFKAHPNKNLSRDNFTFTKMALGIDDPEKEIIRDANVKKSSDSFSESPIVPKKVEIKKPKKALSPKSSGDETPKPVEPAVTTPVRRRAASAGIATVVEKEKETVKETPTNVNKKPVKMPPRKGKGPLAKKPKLAIKSEETMEVNLTPPKPSPGKTRASHNAQNQQKLRERNLKLKSIISTNSASSDEKNEAKFMESYLQNVSFGYNTLLYVFQYLKVQDLLRAGCVCTMWRDIASHPILWRTVRMKNSQVHSFEGLANTLKKHGTVHLDLRKMLLPSNGDDIWPEFSKAIARVDTLRKIELCRCPATVVEQLAASNPDLEVINAVTIKCDSMNLDPFSYLNCIRELRLKSTSGLNINSIDSLKNLKTLKILSLTSVNDLHKLDLNVIAELTNLECLDLGECTDFPKSFGQDILLKLDKLEKLRLERGQGNNCHTFEILDAVKDMKSLEQLELVNFDVKAGFDKALGSCTNIKKLMIIPTYISQSATTNNMVLSGVLRLQGSLTHFVWGVTLELLRVTELFVDQCEDSNKKEKKATGNGDSIPVLKPVPDLSNGGAIQATCNPPQVEILPLPNLQKLLLNSLPTTRVKILKIPFHATWRQTLTDSV